MPAILTVLNPARRRGRRRGNPASLVLVNGKRRNGMAVRRRRRKAAAAPKRRRRTNRRRVTVVNRRRRRRTTRTNPVRRRRRRTAAPRVNRRRRRRTNPARRRRVSRRSNPALKGIVESSIAAVAGMAITDFVQGLVPIQFGGALGKIAVRLGLAYAIGVAAEKFPMTRKYATMLAVGGAVGAAQDAVRLFMGGGLLSAPQQSAQLPAGRAMIPASATGDDQGMGDIVGVPQGWGGLGEIVGVNYPQAYFQ